MFFEGKYSTHANSWNTQTEDKEGHKGHADTELLQFEGKREHFHLEKSDRSFEEEVEFIHDELEF